MSIVLDASALLAYLHDEPGAERVSTALEGAVISAVNWSEILQKSIRAGVDIEGMALDFADIGVGFEAFTTQQAETAATLWNQTRNHGLSLADRACLALAIETARPVLTADRVWRNLGLEIEIQVVR